MNKGKFAKIILELIIVLIVCWIFMFLINYYRASNLKAPFLAIEVKRQDNGGAEGESEKLKYTYRSIEYVGLGYRYVIDKVIFGDEEIIVYANMEAFKKDMAYSEVKGEFGYLGVMPIEYWPQFKAVVVNADNGSLYVNPEFQGLTSLSYNKEDGVQYKKGQELLVTYSGDIMQTYPSQIITKKIEIISESSNIKVSKDSYRYFNDKNKVDINIKSVNESGVVLVIRDENEVPYAYGNITILKKNANGGYYEILNNLNEAENPIYYEVDEAGMLEMKLNYEDRKLGMR